jgi:intracellular sulfur oxidation DsrE/DsrF family protein
MRKSLVSGVLVGFLVLSTGVAQAANKKFVLQISDASPAKQTLVLNVANNLEKHYGVGNVDVEIVAFGPGLRLLFKDNERKGRIQSLNMNGVRFSACSNTVHGMTRILGHAPALNSRAKVVPGGVVRIADLVSQGYILIRP